MCQGRVNEAAIKQVNGWLVRVMISDLVDIERRSCGRWQRGGRKRRVGRSGEFTGYLWIFDIFMGI